MFCHIMRRRLVQLPVLASPFGEVQGKDEQQQKTRAQRKNMWFERVNTSVAEYQLDFIPHLPLVFHVMFFFHPTNWTILTVDCWQMFGLNQVFSKTRKKVWPMCRPSFFFLMLYLLPYYRCLQLQAPGATNTGFFVEWAKWFEARQVCHSLRWMSAQIQFFFVESKSWSAVQFTFVSFNIRFAARCLLTRRILWKKWTCMKSCQHPPLRRGQVELLVDHGNTVQEWMELIENRTIIPTLNSHNFEGIPAVKTHEVMQPGPLQIRLRLLKRCNFENHFPELQKDKLRRHDWEGINHLAGLDREGSIKN